MRIRADKDRKPAPQVAQLLKACTGKAFVEHLCCVRVRGFVELEQERRTAFSLTGEAEISVGFGYRKYIAKKVIGKKTLNIASKTLGSELHTNETTALRLKTLNDREN